MQIYQGKYRRTARVRLFCIERAAIDVLTCGTALLFLLSAARFAQADEQMKREYYSCGKLKIEQAYKDEKPEGIKKSFYENGMLESEEGYSGGRLHGPARAYSDNGTLLFDALFDNGAVAGEVKTFYENGKSLSQLEYQGYKLRGKGLYESGRLLFDVRFDSAQDMNLFRRYYENGSLAMTARFKNESIQSPYPVEVWWGILLFDPKAVKAEGAVTEFYPNGRISSEKHYKHGLKEGLHRKYWENGRLRSQCAYHDDAREGLCADYFENGQLNVQQSFKLGRSFGVYASYHKTGLPAETAVFDNGTREGITRTYYENGKPREQINYLNGLKEGIALKFSNKGVLRFVDTYRHNQIIHRRSLDGQGNTAFEQEYPYRVWVCNQYCKEQGTKGVYNRQNGQLEAIDTFDNGTITSRMIFDAYGKYKVTLKGPIIESAYETPEQ